MNIVEALIQVKKDTQSWVAENLLNKLDKNNPVATGSLSLNRKADSNVGNFSVAEGYETEASGAASHAEGGSTKATGLYSHAEGYETKAEIYGHAEGLGTIAGQGSHAEGSYANASGPWSHAEGAGAESKGEQSHAEGDSTIAGGRSQHVQGEFNIEDEVNDPAARGKYAHIVGNGTYVARSNAHTIAWDGTGWFAGDVYIGGSGQDDETAEKLAKESELENYLPLTGGDLTGDLTITNNASIFLNGNAESNLIYFSNPQGYNTPYITYLNPEETDNTANLHLADDAGDAPVIISGVAEPQNDDHAANKKYVDDAVSEATTGISPKVFQVADSTDTTTNLNTNLFLLDTADYMILKYYDENTASWVPVTVGWASEED